MRDGDAFQELIEIFLGLVVHGLFATAEHDFDAYLAAFLQELLRLGFLEEEVMRIRPETDADALGLDFLLLGLLLLFLLGLAILELAEVSHFADRRHRERGDLHEIRFLFPGQGQSGCNIHCAVVFTIDIYDYDLRRKDLLVDTRTDLELGFRFRSIVTSSSHVVFFKNCVELMGIAPMSRNVFPK